jgi:GGDEF domain-containing protein
MTLDALLKLPHTHETIQAIESFLSLTSNETQIARAKLFYASILSDLNHHDASLAMLYDILAMLKHKTDDPLYVDTLSLIIENDIQRNDFTMAREHIEQKRRALPILKQYLYFMDLIELAKAQQDPYDQYIDKALEDALPEAIKQQFQLFKLDGYVEQGAYDLAMDMIRQLRTRLLSPEIAQKIKFIELDILLESKHYEQILSITQNQSQPIYDYYHLSALIGLKKYHQASIYEVEHEKTFETLSVDIQKKIYHQLVELYDIQKDTLSMDNYQKKLKQLKKQEPIQSKMVEKPTTVEPVTKTEVVIEKKIIPVVEKRPLERSKDFEAIHRLLVSGLSLKSDLDIREKIRLLLTEGLNGLPFSTALIYHQDLLKQFKKERLYDKSIEKEDLFKSVLYTCHQKQEDIIEETDIIRWNYDVLTKAPFDQSQIKRVFTYPLKHGAIAYYQTDDTDVLFYDDYLKLLSTLIEKLLLASDSSDKTSAKLNLYEAVIQSDLAAIKMETETSIWLNQKAMSLLGLNAQITPTEFIQGIQGTDQIKYHPFKQNILKSKTIESIAYTYQEKRIEETAVAITNRGEVVVVSSLSDITDEIQTKVLLQNQARIDGLTGYQNSYAFGLDIDAWFNQKTTFVLLQLAALDAIESLYGKTKVQSFFKEFVDVTKAYFEPATPYVFENHQCMVVLPYNDVRTVEKALNNYFKHLKDTQATALVKQPFQAYAGVIRYPINTTETKLEKFMRFIHLALEKSKRRASYGNFQYFDFQDYQEEQFEVSVIEQMDEAITQEQLKLSYTPIIHLLTNKVFLYQVNPYLEALSVDSNYYYVIAKRRQQIDRLDKYVLKTSFKYLSHLAKLTDKYIRISIQIDEDTVRLKDFNAYVIGLIKQYDLPYSVIELAIKSAGLSPVELMKTKELSDLGIHIGVSEWVQATTPSVHFIHRKDPMKLDQIKTLDFILSFKDFLQNHQMGIIFEHLDDIDKRKLKDFAPVYVKEQKLNYTEDKLTALIQGVK